MAKVINNKELVETIKNQGFATEKQILLLKSRINKSRENAHEMFKMLDSVMPIKLTAEQTAKGREWLLRKNLKNNGQFRKNATLSENEISILKDAKTEAYLSNFYDLGTRYVINNVPIYRYENENDAFDYYVQGGDAQLY
jgi:type I site-specific restriction endonuclease